MSMNVDDPVTVGKYVFLTDSQYLLNGMIKKFFPKMFRQKQYCFQTNASIDSEGSCDLILKPLRAFQDSFMTFLFLCCLSNREIRFLFSLMWFLLCAKRV